jgi:predicted ArsR family transcriptional regulator
VAMSWLLQYALFVVAFALVSGVVLALLRVRSMSIRKKILAALKEKGEMSSLQLSEQLGTGVYGELRMLADAGIVNRREGPPNEVPARKGRPRVYYSLPKPS